MMRDPELLILMIWFFGIPAVCLMGIALILLKRWVR